ncbi:hypothetical protein [Mucilaginibacter achroorhodeus]|nr:hypothetical protein [Mucilaginibacter achroorhodeus]
MKHLQLQREYNDEKMIIDPSAMLLEYREHRKKPPELFRIFRLNEQRKNRSLVIRTHFDAAAMRFGDFSRNIKAQAQTFLTISRPREKGRKSDAKEASGIGVPLLLTCNRNCPSTILAFTFTVSSAWPCVSALLSRLLNNWAIRLLSSSSGT